MSLLLETSLGDLVIDLDIEGSPLLAQNVLKLAKTRYYTGTLLYNVAEGRYCQLGDPKGDGSGGCSIFGLIDATKRDIPVESSTQRFIRSKGRVLTRDEMKEKGRVVAIEMGGMKDTIGSQFMITIDSGVDRSLDGSGRDDYLSLGTVAEDDDGVLAKINGLYCDKAGRPYADVRIIKAHILDDPFEVDPDGLDVVLKKNHIEFMEPQDLPKEYSECSRWLASLSPSRKKPSEEIVEIRISTEDAMKDVDEETEKRRRKEMAQKEDRSNAVMLEMLGDLPSADLKPPENVLFVCKLNPATDDEDLTLIFSRFDQNARAEIIRDQETGDSLQYAFVEFDSEAAANEAYFKMNNALIDDRRIKVDFSQSVAKEWNRYAQKRRGGGSSGGPQYSRNNYRDDRRNDRANGGRREQPYHDTHRGNDRYHERREVSDRRHDHHNDRFRHRQDSPKDEFGRSTEIRRDRQNSSEYNRHDRDYRYRDDRHRMDSKDFDVRRGEKDESRRSHHSEKKRRNSRSRSRSRSRRRSRSMSSSSSRSRDDPKRSKRRRKDRSRHHKERKDKKKKHHKSSHRRKSKHRHRSYSRSRSRDRR